MDQPEATPIADTVFAVVDLETTGFNPQKDRILQMAAVLVNGRGEVVDTFDTVVKPESPEQYEHGAEHVAFPAISTGIYGYPLEPATEIAVAAGAAAPPGIDEVRFVCFDGAVADVYRRILDALRT